jgi:hypothetical protein
MVTSIRLFLEPVVMMFLVEILPFAHEVAREGELGDTDCGMKNGQNISLVASNVGADAILPLAAEFIDPPRYSANDGLARDFRGCIWGSQNQLYRGPRSMGHVKISITGCAFSRETANAKFNSSQ